MIKALIFDLDGTLVNSIGDLADSTNYALSQMGFPCHETEEYNYLVGYGIVKLIEGALPSYAKTADNIEKCFELFMEYYKQHYCVKTRVYPGISELLQSLKDNDYKIAVVSNKSQEMTQKVVKKFFGNIFDNVAGKRDGFATKPDSALTLEIVRQLGVKPKNCILVGDSGIDMATAVNGGLFPLGVLWGFRTKDELIENGAEYTVSSPHEIFEIISGKGGKEVNVRAENTFFS